MKQPGPDHPMSIVPSRKRVRAAFENHVIADTDDAVVVHEADLPPRYYFPMEDVENGFLGKTEFTTHCAYKGDASYWTILMDGNIAENAVWAYEDPFPAASSLRGRVSFDTDRVQIYEVDEEELTRAPVFGGDAGHSTP